MSESGEFMSALEVARALRKYEDRFRCLVDFYLDHRAKVLGIETISRHDINAAVSKASANLARYDINWPEPDYEAMQQSLEECARGEAVTPDDILARIHR